MKLLQNTTYDTVLTHGTVAAIGNFDGIHRGHQALLSSVRALATQLNIPMLVIVFEPQTREYFLKEHSPPRLTSLRKKLQIFKQCGVDYVCCLRFDRHMAQMSAEEFAHSLIFSRLQVKHLFVGSDFRFGCDRRGDMALLQDIGRSFQAHIASYPDFLLDDQRVSSTLVREALQADRLDEAAHLMGRAFTLCGRVMHGDGRARAWGIPTANIKVVQSALPIKGVFFVRVIHQDGKLFQGIANIGRRPTFEGTKAVLEVHLLEFSGSLYGQRLEVIFLHKLRDEIAFSSIDHLVAQIHTDIAAAKEYFLRRHL
ncbi:MAG: bifunctional riboflavin kinase/FMN adenylyltransferase [Legionella sp.]|nr:MAG: bifunctional riboflavin kinase/FMN adenylyltransferase [Legionella sp.]